MSQSNLHKSDAGWARFRDRTGSGSRARAAFMEHRPVSAIGEAVKSGKNGKVEIPAAPEGEYVQRRGRKQRRVRIAN